MNFLKGRDTLEKSIKMYTSGEEMVNAISHGIGAVLGLIGSIYMIAFATLYCDGMAIFSSWVYGISLVMLYTMSTLYHAVSNVDAKKILRAWDHSMIYLLIAGTYTPYALVTLDGTIGYVIFGLVWGSAVIGIILNCISVERFKKISLFLYLATGWAVVLAVKPLIDNLATGGLILLALGGLFYTGGIVFYVMKSKKHFHGIWHLFVLGGSISHFFSIVLYVYR